MKQYLYHRVPRKIIGNIIYPLNQLKDIYPETFQQATQKYVGREQLLMKPIPSLNCLWNDVVFLLAANPVEIDRNIESVGLPSFKRAGYRYFKIPIENFDIAMMTTWIEHEGGEDFSPFTAERMDQYALIPEMQINYWEGRVGTDHYMICPYIAHVLYKGIIDISNAEIITF